MSRKYRKREAQIEAGRRSVRMNERHIPPPDIVASLNARIAELTAAHRELIEAVEKLPELVEDEIRNFTMSHCNADGDHLRMFDLMPDGHEEETIDDIVDQVCGAVVDAIRAARPRGLWKWAGAQTW